MSRDCDASPHAYPDPFDAPIPRVLTASAASPRHAVVLSEPGKHWKKHRQLVTTTRVQTAAPFLRKLGVVLSEPGRSRAGRGSRVPRGLRPQSCRLNPPTTPPKPWSHCRGQEAPSEYTRRPVSRNARLTPTRARRLEEELDDLADKERRSFPPRTERKETKRRRLVESGLSEPESASIFPPPSLSLSLSLRLHPVA